MVLIRKPVAKMPARVFHAPAEPIPPLRVQVLQQFTPKARRLAG
jgi:hypothetical protein